MDNQNKLFEELNELKRKVQIIEDKEAIRDILIKLGFNGDLNRNDAYLKYWTDDCVFTHLPEGTYKGKDQIKKELLLSKQHQLLTNNSQHLFLNYKIDVNGDSATAVGYILVNARLYQSLGIARCGMRSFKFRRIKGQWLITESASVEIGNPECHKLIPEDE